MGCLENSVTRIEATAAIANIAALEKFEAGPGWDRKFAVALTPEQSAAVNIYGLVEESILDVTTQLKPAF